MTCATVIPLVSSATVSSWDCALTDRCFCCLHVFLPQLYDESCTLMQVKNWFIDWFNENATNARIINEGLQFWLQFTQYLCTNTHSILSQNDSIRTTDVSEILCDTLLKFAWAVTLGLHHTFNKVTHWGVTHSWIQDKFSVFLKNTLPEQVPWHYSGLILLSILHYIKTFLPKQF